MSNHPRTIGSGVLGAALVLGASLGAAAQQELGGYTFETLAPVTTEGFTAVDGIAELADGRLGVLGHRCPGGGDCFSLSWTSTDGGQSWEEAQPDIAGPMVAMVADGDRFLAVGDRGRDAATHKATVYASPDALSWEAISTLDNALIGAARKTPDGIALIGADRRAADGFGDRLAGYPTLWLSDDAVEWTTHEISEPQYEPGGDEVQRPEWFARNDDGTWLASMVHLEFEGEGEPLRTSRVWHAGPSLEWAGVDLPEEISEVNQLAFVYGATPAGFVLTANDFAADTTSIWITGDGSDWTQVAETGAIPHIEVVGTVGAGAIGFKPAFATLMQGPELLDGSPMYVSSDAIIWEDAGMLEGIAVRHVVELQDGRIFVAGRNAPCVDFPSCAFFTPEDEVPVLMIGTPS